MIRGVIVYRGVPWVSHILFANDTLIYLFWSSNYSRGLQFTCSPNALSVCHRLKTYGLFGWREGGRRRSGGE